VLHSVLVALFLAGPLRRLRLPGGAIAAMLLYDGLLVAASTDLWRYLPAVIGAALLGEAIWARMWRGGLHGTERERRGTGSSAPPYRLCSSSYTSR
jgi:hypothetical protein